MVTVKVKFRASSSVTKEGTLYLKVIYDRVARQISTGLRLFAHEWDARKSMTIQSISDENGRNAYLMALDSKVKAEQKRIKRAVALLQKSCTDFTVDDIVERYISLTKDNGFLSFLRNYIVHLAKAGRRSAVDKMKSALNSFIRFHGDDEVPFDNINSDMMEIYEGWLKRQGVCMNTVSFYMRTLRIAYNIAVERGLTMQQNPFKYVYTGIDTTVKRAVPLKTIRQIRNLDLSLQPQKDFARDLFLFSFYTRGMSFVDMAYLKKKDLQNGILIYRRHKTNQQFTIKWEKPMQEIINKYDTSGSPYLLPIIKNNGKDERLQYQNAMHRMNKQLKAIGSDIGLAIPLTSYVARHGWASIAHSTNIPTAIISEALGHNSEKTTRIYLATLDTSAVDKANRQILKML